ncbi:MAG: prolipoprotein diacylglyceryl transferase [Candidatus Woesearchaeota archaeon]|nr:prolipoprotein diacylglyceryl transferase [Candidatus Woesearchaeota archaeon]
MFIWDLNPVLLALGPIEIRFYGLVYMLGFLAGYFMLYKTKVLEKKLAEEYIFLLVMGSIIASRLVYVLVYNPGYYFSNPLDIPAVWKGGLSIHGGILGAVAVTWHFCKKHKINFYTITDTIVFPLAITYAFGRIANFVNGELWGTLTSAPWCVDFSNAPAAPEGCRHPSQLYQAVYGFVIAGILYSMRGIKNIPGIFTWTFITLYGLFRFLVTFFREADPTDPVIIFSIGQWLSLSMVFLGCWWLWRHGDQLRKTFK